MERNSASGGTLTPDRPEASRPEVSAPPSPTPHYGSAPEYGAPMTPPGMPPRYLPYPYAYGNRPPVERRASRGWLIAGIVALVLFALFVALIIGTIVLAVNVAGPTYSSSATHTFMVTGTPIVSVYDTAGSVTVRTGNVEQVVVQIVKHVRTLDSNGAQRALDATAVTTMQSGNAVTVDGHFATRWQDGSWYSRTVDMTLTVPARTDATLHVAAGSINVADVSGALTVEANAGTVTANNVTLANGSGVTANAGAISLAGAIAPNADVRIVDNAGSVTLRLPADTPARLDASVSVGSISVSGWPIAVSRPNTVGATATGDLGVNPTGTLHVDVNAGNLSLSAQ
jgi:hypothetical protein